MKTPILGAPDWNEPFQLHIDASQYAVRATLTQNKDEGRTRVIAYSSKKMTAAEQNYTANDLQLMAFVLELQRFRCHWEGTTFSVITDK